MIKHCAVLRLAVIFSILVFTTKGYADRLQIIVSIKPLYLLLNELLPGTEAELELLIPASQSPHDYVLKPSDIKKIQQADLVVWMGPYLETALEKPLQSLAATRLIRLIDTPGLIKLPWHHGDMAEKDHLHDYAIDPHLWLNPVNAERLLEQVTLRLSELDPTHTERYRQNQQLFSLRAKALDSNMHSQLAAVKNLPLIAFHDAYGYLEYYGLNIVEVVSLHPGHALSVKHMVKLRDIIKTQAVKCLLKEPQLTNSMLQPILADFQVKVVDTYPENPPEDDYWTMMASLLNAISSCR